jgi:hypothetical protein
MQRLPTNTKAVWRKAAGLCKVVGCGSEVCNGEVSWLCRELKQGKEPDFRSQRLGHYCKMHLEQLAVRVGTYHSFEEKVMERFRDLTDLKHVRRDEVFLPKFVNQLGDGDFSLDVLKMIAAALKHRMAFQDKIGSPDRGHLTRIELLVSFQTKGLLSFCSSLKKESTSSDIVSFLAKTTSDTVDLRNELAKRFGSFSGDDGTRNLLTLYKSIISMH